jgi:hypothetical protein
MRTAIGDLVRSVEDVLNKYALEIEPEDAELLRERVEIVREVLGESDHLTSDDEGEEEDPIEEREEREDNFLSDSEADADALKGIGWGTDEDYRGWEDIG